MSPTAEPYDISAIMAGGRAAAKWRVSGLEAGLRLGLAGKQRPFPHHSSYTSVCQSILPSLLRTHPTSLEPSKRIKVAPQGTFSPWPH